MEKKKKKKKHLERAEKCFFIIHCLKFPFVFERVYNIYFW